MKRGDIVTVTLQGDLKKPRPAVILQSDEYNESHLTLLACPFTSHLIDAPQIRPTVLPSSQNGLETISQVMVDKTTPAKKSVFGQVIGHVEDQDMANVETALINITGIRQLILPVSFSSESGAP